jgi:protein SCO1
MSARRPFPQRLLLLLAAAVWTAAPAAAQHGHHAGHAQHAGGPAAGAGDPHAAHRAMTAAGAGGEAERVSGLDIPDVAVLTQDGEPRRFYSDLVRGRVVAMNFVFTTCTTICPPMGANFGRLQQELGERLGRDVHLISVSVDPTTDTPQRLAAWAARFGARDGWTLVTGDQQEVERLLKSLQVFNADIREHSPVVLIGDEARGEWTRAWGLAGPAELAAIIARVGEGADEPDGTEDHDAHAAHGGHRAHAGHGMPADGGRR